MKSFTICNLKMSNVAAPRKSPRRFHTIDIRLHDYYNARFRQPQCR